MAQLGVDVHHGAVYHPQSQGFIEARHKPINKTIRAYASANPQKWARYIKLAQWAMRATPGLTLEEGRHTKLLPAYDRKDL